MMRSNWRRDLIAVTSFAIALSACTGSGTTASNSPGSGSKTLVYATPALPLTFDPCLINGQQTAEILTNLYSTWTYYKVGTLASGQPGDSTATGEAAIGPGMLQSWEVSSDGTTYTLHIRQGAKDSYGTEMTADDMKWLLSRYVNFGGCPFIAANLGITDANKQVVVKDKYTLTVTLAGPDAIFLRMLTVNNGAALGAEVRKHTTAADPWGGDWAKNNAPATGPYKVGSFTPGVQLTLVANPNFYGAKPSITTIIYKEVPSDANRVAVLDSGQVQAARDLTQDELNTIAQSPGAAVSCTTANVELNVAMNTANGPTSNVQVRQALAYAVPYSDILQSVYNGRAGRLYGMSPAIYPGFIGSDKYPYNTDYTKAKQLLSAAGYANGFNATLAIDSDVPEHERTAILLQNSFKQIGVTLAINKMPAAAYTSALQNRTFGDLAIWQDSSLVADIAYHSLLFLSTSAPPSHNFSGWINPQVDALGKQSLQVAGASRDAILQQIQVIFNANLPWLPLANTPTCFAFTKNVSNYTWHMTNQVYFSDLKIS